MFCEINNRGNINIGRMNGILWSLESTLVKIKIRKQLIICIYLFIFGLSGCSGENTMKVERYDKEAGTLKVPQKPKAPKDVTGVKAVDEVKEVVTPNTVKEPKAVKRPKEIQVEEETIMPVIPSEPTEYNNKLNNPVEPVENTVVPNLPVMVEP